MSTLATSHAMKSAADIIVEASKRPVIDVEYYNFNGTTKIDEAEIKLLSDGAVTPTFEKAPRWHPERMIMSLAFSLALMPLIPAIAILILYHSTPCFILGVLLLLASLGAFTLFFWMMNHEMWIYPKDGVFGQAKPDEAYKGLVLIVRDLVKTEAYGYRIQRCEALIAHNYGFAVIHRQGSDEMTQFTVLKRYADNNLRITMSRQMEKWSDYKSIMKKIEDRLAQYSRQKH